MPAESRIARIMRMADRRSCVGAALLRVPRRGPRGWHERIWTIFGTALVMACLLVSCHQPPAKVVREPDLSQLELDPSKFTRLALRDDVAVTTEEIQARRGAAPRTRWYVVAYREHENRKGFVPDRESEFTNLYLVSEVEWTGERDGSLKDRYLVAELWHYYLDKGIKTCHQWIIWESDLQTAPARASFQLLVEDFDNVLLANRHAPLDPPTLKRLQDFYLEVKPRLVERARRLPADLAPRV